MKKKMTEKTNHDCLTQLVSDVGYLRGVVEGIDEKVTQRAIDSEKHYSTVNGELAEVKRKIAGYDIWFGKFGAGMAVLAVVFSLFINFAVDLVKRWLGWHG